MPMKTTLSAEQVKKIQEAIKKFLAGEFFDRAPFLKIFRQQLQVLSDKFDNTAQEIFSSESLVSKENNFANRQLVYISVYSAEGKNMDAWHRVLLNLPKQYVSRPIYAKEEDAQYAARNKGLLTNEGYVAIWVEKSSIMSKDDQLFDLKDKFDHALVTLKDKAIDIKNINYFWVNSSQYILKNGRLVFSKSVDDFIY